MIGIDIVAGRSPHGLAAGIEKAEPDRNIIGVGAKRVPRADPRQRQVEKEAIQIGIIERVTAQDQRHMRIETLGLAALANSNRSEEHTSELQSLMRITYAVFCLQTKKINTHHNYNSIVQPT